MTRDREEIVYFMILDDSLWVSSRWLDYVVQARKMAMKVVVAISKETGMVWEAQGSVGVYYYNRQRFPIDISLIFYEGICSRSTHRRVYHRYLYCPC